MNCPYYKEELQVIYFSFIRISRLEDFTRSIWLGISAFFCCFILEIWTYVSCQDAAVVTAIKLTSGCRDGGRNDRNRLVHFVRIVPSGLRHGKTKASKLNCVCVIYSYNFHRILPLRFCCVDTSTMLLIIGFLLNQLFLLRNSQLL